MSVIVNKLKSAFQAKPAGAEFEVNINTKSALAALNELEAKLDAIVKKAGAYNDGYGAPEKGNKPEKDPELTGNNPNLKAEEVPGVPGTTAEEEDVKKEYDDKYVAPKAEDVEDKTEESSNDMAECVCDKCGSHYKAKKAEDKKDEKPKEPEDKKEEVLPEKQNTGYAMNWGNAYKGVAKPTKAECEELKKKSFRSDLNVVFGHAQKAKTVGAQLTEQMFKEYSNSIPKK